MCVVLDDDEERRIEFPQRQQLCGVLVFVVAKSFPFVPSDAHRSLLHLEGWHTAVRSCWQQSFNKH